MDIRSIVTAARHHWRSLTASALIGLTAGTVYLLLSPTTYTATAAMFVSANSSGSVADLNQGSTFTQQIVKSYAQVATTPLVLDPVIKGLHLRMTSSDLAMNVQATAPLDTVLIQVAVTDRSGSRAASIANAIGVELSGAVDRLTPRVADQAASVKITQVERATAPTTPSAPRPALSIFGGVVLGLLAGIAGVAVRRSLDVRVRDVLELERIVGAPALGSVPTDSGAKVNPLVLVRAPSSATSEAIRRVRASLRFLSSPDRCNLYVVTSAAAGEGKSTVAANLSIAAAELGQRVLLVDADLRRPRVAEYMGVNGTLGLADILTGSASLAQAATSWGALSLDVLPAGSAVLNPSTMIDSSAMRLALVQFRDAYDLVIVDSPPILPVADAPVLVKESDGAIIISNWIRGRRPWLADAVAILERIDAPVVGTILAQIPMRGDAYSYEYASGHGAARNEEPGRNSREPSGGGTSEALTSQ